MLRPFLLATLLAVPAIASDQATRDQVTEYFKHRQWAEAQALLEKVTTEEPRNAEAWNSLGQVHLARGNPDQAVASLEKAAELDPASSENQLQLGHAYGLAAMKAGLFSKMGFAKKCKAAYDRAVELDPKNINARWSVMEYCRQAPSIVGGGMDQAYTQAEAIKQLDARRGRAAYTSLYLSEKKYPEAFALHDEVLKDKPDDADALFNVGRIAAASGQQLDRGLTSLRSLAAQPDRRGDARLHTLIGNILEKQGDKAGALTAYETAVAADPKNTRALEALRKLKQG